MTLEAITQEIRALPIEQRKQLVVAIFDSLLEERPAQQHDIREFRGVGAHLRDIDAQEYVNKLRQEWDDHP